MSRCRTKAKRFGSRFGLGHGTSMFVSIPGRRTCFDKRSLSNVADLCDRLTADRRRSRVIIRPTSTRHDARQGNSREASLASRWGDRRCSETGRMTDTIFYSLNVIAFLCISFRLLFVKLCSELTSFKFIGGRCLMPRSSMCCICCKLRVGFKRTSARSWQKTLHDVNKTSVVGDRLK